MAVVPVALTREAATLVVFPIVHERHGRVTRWTWGAGLRLVGDPAGGPVRTRCPHSHGHRTVTAAHTCARRLWRALPTGGDR